MMARTHKSNYFPCRCKKKNDCSYRVTLRKPPDAYARPRCCPRCGSPLIVDNYRIKQRQLPGHLRKDNPTCYCAAAAGRDGQNRPHRKGSMPLCEHYQVPF